MRLSLALLFLIGSANHAYAFSAPAVPEPASVLLLALGAGGLALHRLRARRR